MQPDPQLVQQALSSSAAALTIHPADAGDRTFGRRLEQLTRAAVDSVPGADFVVLTMRHRAGGLESLAPTGPEVAELDRLQVMLDEGPCLDAVTVGTTTVVDVPDFGAQTGRWPRFAPAAVAAGMNSLLSFAMAPDGAVPGAVNFYSRSRAGFDATSKGIAGAFATQAAIAVYGARLADDLERAVQTRDVIGQAKGILMQRHRIGADDAFAMLVGASKDTNVKLVDVARCLTQDVTTATDAGTDTQGAPA